MAQVVVGDFSSDTADGSSVDVTHIVASGEALIVCVVLGDNASDKEVADVLWDQGGGDEVSLGSATFTHNPADSSRRLEVWDITAPVAKTATVRVTIEGGNSQKMWAGCFSVSNPNTTTLLSDQADDSNSGATSFSVDVTQQADDLGIIFGTNSQKEVMAGDNGEDEHDDQTVQGDYQVWAGSLDGGPTLGATNASSGINDCTGFLVNAAAVGGADVFGAYYQQYIESVVRG